MRRRTMPPRTHEPEQYWLHFVCYCLSPMTIVCKYSPSIFCIAHCHLFISCVHIWCFFFWYIIHFDKRSNTCGRLIWNLLFFWRRLAHRTTNQVLKQTHNILCSKLYLKENKCAKQSAIRRSVWSAVAQPQQQHTTASTTQKVSILSVMNNHSCYYFFSVGA